MVQYFVDSQYILDELRTWMTCQMQGNKRTWVSNFMKIYSVE